MSIESILKLIVLKLIAKNGSFGSFYTLHQVYMRLGVSIELSEILSELVKKDYLIQRKSEGTPSNYSLTENGEEFLRKERLTDFEFDQLETGGLKKVSFIRDLIGTTE